ncbi:hypothetical protein MKEN_00499000 [Mycena kentingensis (nom. inval.)]|nr:hypothetical protein MKEN_00499000 [Mycena kentingensis (nom. inval.)]
MQSDHSPRPALQSHVAFFDQDGDGIIWPKNTFVDGSERCVFFSALSMVVIHSGFSCAIASLWTRSSASASRTSPRYAHRSPLVSPRNERRSQAIHGSDSASYKQDGSFDPARFDDLFARYSAAPNTHMSFAEGVAMVRANRNAFDPVGTSSTDAVSSVYVLFKPEDGKVTKEDVRGILDGSLFPKLAAKNAKKDA